MRETDHVFFIFHVFRVFEIPHAWKEKTVQYEHKTHFHTLHTPSAHQHTHQHRHTSTQPLSPPTTNSNSLPRETLPRTRKKTMTFAINRQISTSSAQPLTAESAKTKGKKGAKSPSIFKLLKKSIGRLIKGSSSARDGKNSNKKIQKMQQQSSQLLKLRHAKQASRASGLGRLDAKVQSSGDEQDSHDLEEQQRKLVAMKMKHSTHSFASPRVQSPLPPSTSGARRQAPAEQLEAGPAVVAKFIVKNVNQMKSQPLTLGEKLSRWCRQSPAAIFKGCAPEDHFLPFPSADYCDMEVDTRAEAELLAAIAAPNKAVEAEARDEVVLERYPAGRHGLSPRTRPTGTPEAAAAAAKAIATLLKEIKGRRSHARIHHLQAKLKKRDSQQTLALGRKIASQPELKALQWMKAQQHRAATGTTISMAAGVGSTRNLSDCLGSTLDLNRMRDASLARVVE